MTYRSQAVASVALGTPSSLALCGIYADYGPGAPATCYMTALLLLLPVWCCLIFWGLAQQRPRQAWLKLGALSLLVLLTSIALRLCPGVSA